MQLVGTSILELQEKRDCRTVCPDPGGPLIRIDKGALRQLEMQIREGVNAIRGHGVEIGGLIVGLPVDWNASEILITGFIPVEIEYRFGPTFRASPNDAETFRKVAAEADESSETEGSCVIGYYRSQLRNGFSLREEDRRLISQLFPDGDCCMASIAADAYTASAIDLHRVQAGAAPVLLARFPVKENQLLPVAAAPLPAKEPPPAPSSLPEVFAPGYAEPETRPATSAARKWSAYLWAAQTRATRTRATGTRVARTWRAPAWLPSVWLVAIVIAALAGGFTYSLRKSSLPKSDTVPDRRTSAVAEPKIETKVVSSDAPRAETAAVRRPVDRAVKETRPARSDPQKPKRALTNQGNPEPEPTQRPDMPPTTVAGDAAIIPAEPVRAVVPPERPQPVPVLSDPQLSSPQLSSPQLSSSPLSSSPLSSSPPSFPASPSSPAPSPDQTAVAHRFTAPRILHQVVPAVPLGVAPGILAEVQLDVKVTVDATGKVAEAQVVGSRGGAAGLLIIPTLKAAQLYRFAPSEEDGHPIPGTMVLTFRFARKPN